MTRRSGSSGIHLVVVGVGNIGSHTAGHLARLEELARLTIIDSDTYEAKNLRSQNIAARDVGARKASVQARRLRSIRPDLRVDGIAAGVEEVPWGRLRADAILACLDSREARRVVNEIAMRLGVTWIDAGVKPDEYLARVTVYAPGDGLPCLECDWLPTDYAALPARAPCARQPSGVPGTDGPSYLGALAASLQLVELRQLLAGTSAEAAGRQVVFAPLADKLHAGRHVRNPHCLVNHGQWTIERLEAAPRELTLRDLLARAAADLGEAPRSLAVAGRVYEIRSRCMSCGRVRRTGRFAPRGRSAARRCADCDGEVVVPGTEIEHRLDVSGTEGKSSLRTLDRLGVRPADIVGIAGTTSERHYEIAAAPSRDRAVGERP